VRYWAAARAAAGVDEETYEATTVAELLAAVVVGRDPQFVAVLARSSLLVDGQAVGGRDRSSVLLPEGGVVEVLPPFAGG
jgi:molybdopterin converting factor small subunit